MLENTELEEFVVWRLMPQPTDRTVHSSRTEFEVNGKSFIQLFVNDFTDCFNFTQFPKPYITLFRGGFPEYAEITKTNPDFFGLKLYLGAGRRIQPQYGGIYDKVLVEDERDYGANTIPFYKTANPNIFYPIDLEKKWDICWPCNFAQLKYKGQEWFIKQVSKSDYLKSLKILHLGNKPEIGMDLCKKYGVNNIDFKGWVTRTELNKYLNQSKAGLVTSNMLDGNPRVMTEIMSSGTPVIIRNDSRYIDDYFDMIEFSERGNCALESQKLDVSVKNNIIVIPGLFVVDLTYLVGISLDRICQKNLELWNYE